MRYILYTLLGMGLIIPNIAQSAPQTFNTALPLAKGQGVIRQQFIVGEFESGGTTERTELTSLSIIGYGLNKDLAVFGVIPYNDRELDLASGDTRDTRGLGDIRALARYTFWQKRGKGTNIGLAAIGGVELPTGENEETDAIGLLPPILQSGSGSFDPFFGFLFSYSTLKWQAHAQVLGQDNREADDVERGNTLRFDTSYQHRLYNKGSDVYFYGLIETNLIHTNEDEINGVENPNTGGTRLFLSPALQYVTQDWILEGGIQIPIAQNMNGTALENDYIASVGFRFNF